MQLASFLALSAVRADDSWVHAYNAGFVRVKASGLFEATMDAASPGLLRDVVRSLGDCPATPETYPFPSEDGLVLGEILSRGAARLAFQFPSTGLDEQATIDFPKAIWEILKAVVHEISIAYNTSLVLDSTDYAGSVAAVDAVAAGDADFTDFFLRQWTLIPSEKVQRRTRVTPGCTAWVATLSVSWNSTRDGWVTLRDVRDAGPSVIIPVYSTMQAFKLDIGRLLPNATLLDRPEQNFEANASDTLDVVAEFMRGGTTALMAARSDLAGVTTLTIPQLLGVDIDFNLDDISDMELRVDLPVGPFLRDQPNLEDSLSWHKNFDPSKTCEWVANKLPKRCFVKGNNGSERAFEACQRACLGVGL